MGLIPGPLATQGAKVMNEQGGGRRRYLNQENSGVTDHLAPMPRFQVMGVNWVWSYVERGRYQSVPWTAFFKRSPFRTTYVTASEET